MFQQDTLSHTFSIFHFFPICFHNFSIFPIVSLSHAFSYLHKLKINHYISAEVKVETLECMRIYLHDHDSKARFLQPGSGRWGPAVWQEDEENGDSIDWEPLERILGRAWWETDGKRHETGNSVKWHETVRETVRNSIKRHAICEMVCGFGAQGLLAHQVDLTWNKSPGSMADSRELPVEKIVLVIGETGVGKSTIVNMLYNRDPSVDCCKYPQPTGSTSSAVTRFSTMQFDFVRKWALLDTIGVGDPNLSQQQILGSIRNLIKNTSKGVHSVVVVMKMGRASHASRANAHVLSYLFSPRNIKTHGVLVLTHWEGDLGNEDRDLADWHARDPEMQKYCRQFSKVILTNNQLQGRGAYPECRQKCLEQLCSHVTSMEGKIKARPVTPREIFVSLLEKFGDLLWGSAVSLTSMVLGCQDEEVPTYCGECAVCLQNMEIRQACKLVCHHSFHNDCIRNLATCPVCRAAAVTEWQFLEMFLLAGVWLEQFNRLYRKSWSQEPKSFR